MGIADKDYFLDNEGNVTTDDEKAAFVLINKGQDIPKEMADKYGIGKVTPTAEGEAEETVKASKPAKNKSAKPAENKAEEADAEGAK